MSSERTQLVTRSSLLLLLSLALVPRQSWAQDTPPATPPDAPPAAPPMPSEPPPAAPPAEPPPPAPPSEPPAAPSAPVTPPPPPSSAQPPTAPFPPTPAPQNPAGTEPPPPTGRAAFPAPPPPAPPPKKHRVAKPEPEAAPEPAAPAPHETAPEKSSAKSSAESTPAAQSPPEPDDDSDGLFGPFRLGFLVGTGLPDVLNLGGTIKLTRYFGAGVNVGIIPSVHLSLYGDATLSYQEYDMYGHIHPFGGSFFLGASVGYATMNGKFSESYVTGASAIPIPTGFPSSFSVDSEASVRTLVLTPQIGLLHTFGSGFSLGLDAGLQVPIAPSQIKYSTKYSPGNVESLCATYAECANDKDSSERKVRDTLTTIGRTMLPTFHLRIGWLL